MWSRAAAYRAAASKILRSGHGARLFGGRGHTERGRRFGREHRRRPCGAGEPEIWRAAWMADALQQDPGVARPRSDPGSTSLAAGFRPSGVGLAGPAWPSNGRNTRAEYLERIAAAVV